MHTVVAVHIMVVSLDVVAGMEHRYPQRVHRIIQNAAEVPRRIHLRQLQKLLSKNVLQIPHLLLVLVRVTRVIPPLEILVSRFQKMPMP
jgi:hypothetical protein